MTAFGRRQFLAAGGLSLAALAGCTGSDGTSTPTDTGAVTLTGRELVSGLASPVGVAVPSTETYYIADQAGQVYYLDGPDAELATAIDLTDRMVDPGGETGLLGLATHPEYDGSGRVYLRYSAPNREGTPSDFSHTFVLSEFTADSGTIDPDSERTLLEIPEPQPNHNAGAIAFGPDGYLYIGVGDGGGANDQGPGHVDDWYDAVGGGNGQDVTDNLLGSLLRIDVDDQQGERPYGIPDDNPLVGREGLDEQYAWGFRNPWRFSFGPEGRLFVADVGQSDFEEVNVVDRGGNYGWNVREGRDCFQAEDCPETGPDGAPLLDPAIQYPHEGDGVTGISVIGGYVYTGEAIPELQGRYVFADFVPESRLFVATERGEGWETETVPVDGIGSNVLSFGQTPAGELLVCTRSGGLGAGEGAVFRLQPS